MYFSSSVIFNAVLILFFSPPPDALKRVAKIYPKLLHQKLHSCRSNFRNKTGVDALLEYCQDILKGD